MAAGEGRLVGSRSYRTLEILEMEPKVMGWEEGYQAKHRQGGWGNYFSLEDHLSLNFLGVRREG